MPDSLFEFESEEAERLYIDLIKATNGTEPCYDPYLVEPDGKVRESVTDLFVENYANRGVTPEQAEAMCAGCHVLEQCREYARANGEPYGVWGGETPRQRGFYRGKRIKNVGDKVRKN